jgi:hypothetical protein
MVERPQPPKEARTNDTLTTPVVDGAMMLSTTKPVGSPCGGSGSGRFSSKLVMRQ